MALVETLNVEYPIKNTFIEYPIERSVSLELFMRERETQSEPATVLMSRLESLEEDFPKLDASQKDSEPGKIETLVKNTFIDFPAMRSLSLEEFLQKRHARSAPGSWGSGIMQFERLESLEEEPCPAERFPATPSTCQRGITLESLEEGVEEEAPPADMPMTIVPMSIVIQPRPPLQCQPMPTPAVPAYSQDYNDESSCYVEFNDNEFSHTRSTSAGTESDPLLDVPAFSMEPQKVQQHRQVTEPVIVELNSILGHWSIGSTGHHFGNCKPCAFFWKEEGCKDGQACQFCHTCAPDEKKRRTKQKVAWRKAVKSARTALRYGLF